MMANVFIFVCACVKERQMLNAWTTNQYMECRADEESRYSFLK